LTDFLDWLHRTGPLHWVETDKADPRCVRLADRHYSRQTPGSPFFTRPGFNFTLYACDDFGEAVFNWWRGIRDDGVNAIECTMFRNESRLLSSTLIEQAVSALQCWKHACPAKVITSVSSEATAGRRSRRNRPGHCFRVAGWVDFDHAPGFADTWLICERFPAPRRVRYEPRGQLDIFGGRQNRLASVAA
jgi:hypothetical protein